MIKHEVLARIQHTGVVAVVRAENETQALKIAHACLKVEFQHRTYLYCS